MRLAPIGAFGAMAFTVGKYGIGSLVPLAQAGRHILSDLVVFVFVVLGLIARVGRVQHLQVPAYIREEILIVLGTSSSDPALPRLMEKLESSAARKPVVGLVVPTGYAFNTDGTSIYMTSRRCSSRKRPTPTDVGAAAGDLRGRDADLQGRERRDRRVLHRAGRNARRGADNSGRRNGADPRHRPLHERGPRAREHDRKRRRGGGDGKMGRRTGSCADAGGLNGDVPTNDALSEAAVAPVPAHVRT